jgi:hydrogenase expression/formation protein HypC
MCLAIPYKIIEVNGKRAEIEVAGAKQRISIEMLPEVKAGDWVLVNLGLAFARVDEAEAKEIMKIYCEMLVETPERSFAGVVDK